MRAHFEQNIHIVGIVKHMLKLDDILVMHRAMDFDLRVELE